MSSTARRRELFVSLRLILCIAVGIWLGALAVALTGMLIYQNLAPAQIQALTQLSGPATPVQAPAPEPQTEMFRKYEQNLRESEARQAQEQRQSRFNRAKCDFWMQQDRTAPSEKSRASINEHCG